MVASSRFIHPPERTPMTERRCNAWTLVSLAVLWLAPSAALADITWRGDFSTNNLFQFQTVQCGAYSGASGVAGTCPYGKQERNQATTTSTDLCPNAGADAAGCRFSLVAPPKPAASATSKYWPAGSALKVRVARKPDTTDTEDEGDRAPALSYPWGGDHRNELVSPRINGVEKQYGDNDDVYYGWNVFVPGTSEFDAPGAYQNGRSYWHSVLQFHSVGACGSPNIQVGITRSDVSGGSTGQGSDYIFSLSSINSYPGTEAVRLWPQQQSTGLERSRWHHFVLRVRWKDTACNNGTSQEGNCQAQTPNGGLIQLWRNGQLVYQQGRQTLFHFNPSACTDDGAQTGLMPAYLKYGMYRHREIPGFENVYLSGLRTGTAYADVDPVPWAHAVATTQDDTQQGLAVDGNGSAFVVGYTGGDLEGTRKGFTDAFVRKVHFNGATAWTVQGALSTSTYDRVSAVAHSAVDDSIVVAGTTEGSLFGDAQAGAGDAFVAKLTQGGAVSWGKMFGGSRSQQANAIAADPTNGDIYVAGSTYEGSASNPDGFLAKFSRFGGAPLWYRTNFVSTTGIDSITAITMTSDRRIYVAGQHNSQGYVAKVSTEGVIEWSQPIGPTGYTIVAMDIEEDGQNGVYVVGYTTTRVDGGSPAGRLYATDAFVIRYNASTGGLLWAKQYGDGDEFDATARGVAVDGRGIAHVVGGRKANHNDPNCAADFACFPYDWEVTIHRFDTGGAMELVDTFGLAGDDLAGSAVFGLNHLFVGGIESPGRGYPNGMLRRY